ncbi:lysyl-tRNA synthetase, class II [Pancytospora philotis]|nr:lysyl-tRNA synthetase, class II [Pancytospora philotis]
MAKATKELNEEEFFTQRKEQLAEAARQGINLYPHRYEVRNSVREAREAASKYEKDSCGSERMQSAGRVVTIRGHGKLFFFTIESDGVELQLILNKGDEQIYRTAELLRRGDIIGFAGCAGCSRSGEPSVFVEELVLLSPCLHVIPSSKTGLTNAETIYRKRHIDLLVNKESKQRFVDRARVIQYVRNYLGGRGFIEVETPMMNAIHGGAAAKPFKTHHNELKMDLFMRVAPELYLKKLVIGGLDRVFELGKQFRNEGIDLTHNPEFTSVEFYEAYADHHVMMQHVEQLLSGLAVEMKGSTRFSYEIAKRGSDTKNVIELDFSAPFQKFDILTELNRVLGLELTGESIAKPESLDLLVRCAKERGLSISAPVTLNRIIDLFIGEYIEPQCVNPTFVTGFPTVTSPLAKDDRDRPGLTERFELFVNGKELCNAYTELNIPEVQRQRFRMQSADAQAGDEEAMPTDEDFCQALEYGLPPTGGCGIGIDRLVMYMTNAANIRDVLLFPAMRPEN